MDPSPLYLLDNRPGKIPETGRSTLKTADRLICVVVGIEDRQQLCHHEETVDFLSRSGDLQMPFGVLTGGEARHEHSQTPAVDPFHMGKIDNDLYRS